MREQYLLRTDWQIKAFRNRYAKFIQNNHDRFLEWFLKLPLYEWVRLPFQETKMEAGLGLFCLLYIDGEINLCVDKTVTHIQRFANSDEEYEEYITKHFINNPKSYEQAPKIERRAPGPDGRTLQP